MYAAGYFCDFRIESPSYCDYFVQKLDPSGNELFTTIYERLDTCDLLLDMVQTRPNKIMLIGWTCNDTTQNNTDLMFITVDTLGNELNRIVWGGGATDFVSSGVVVGEDGDVMMTGYTRSFPSTSSGRTWVVKTDSVGNVKWQRTYSGVVGIGSSQARINMLNDGNLIIAGGSASFGPSSYGGDGSLLKIDTSGNQIWAREYEVMGGQGLWGVVGLENGTIVSCGVTDGPSGSQAGWLIKTDENGDTLWTRTYDSSDETDYLRNMTVLPNGDIVMVGFGRPEGQTNQDGWILRVDSMGCLEEGCWTVGIDDRTINERRFAIFPNPASDVVRVRFSDSSTGSSVGMTIRVFDGVGRRVWLQTLKQVQGDASVDVSGWAEGVYLITVTDEDGNISAERLVVQHLP